MSSADETVSFALDGTNYEIDLSDKNAKELRDAFSRYVSAARKVGRGTGRASGGGRSRAFRGFLDARRRDIKCPSQHQRDGKADTEQDDQHR